MSVHSVTRNLP